MDTTSSKDGTSIAFDKLGDGPPVVIVAGALSTRAANVELAALLADSFTVFNYDRRGRADSGDTQPYTPEREVEDIAAILDWAGGSASLVGSSSGSNLAVLAASRLDIDKLGLWEHLDTAGRPALAQGLHNAASNAFFDGFQTSVLVAVAVTLVGAVAAAILIPNQPPDTACIELDKLTGAQLSLQRP